MKVLSPSLRELLAPLWLSPFNFRNIGHYVSEIASFSPEKSPQYDSLISDNWKYGQNLAKSAEYKISDSHKHIISESRTLPVQASDLHSFIYVSGSLSSSIANSLQIFV